MRSRLNSSAIKLKFTTVVSVLWLKCSNLQTLIRFKKNVQKKAAINSSFIDMICFIQDYFFFGQLSRDIKVD